MKKQLGPTDILFPIPAALVACGTMEDPNVLTVAWIGMMGSDPPVLAVSLKKTRHSVGLIRARGAFSVNIPSAKHFRETDYCGLVSGRKRRKFRECGFTAVPGSVVEAPLVDECPFNLECRVLRETELGDWIVIFGEVVETHVDADKTDPDTGRIDVSRMDLLVYCATVREYWTMGKRLGFGFSAGKDLIAQREEGSSGQEH